MYTYKLSTKCCNLFEVKLNRSFWYVEANINFANTCNYLHAGYTGFCFMELPRIQQNCIVQLKLKWRKFTQRLFGFSSFWKFDGKLITARRRRGVSVMLIYASRQPGNVRHFIFVIIICGNVV